MTHNENTSVHVADKHEDWLHFRKGGIGSSEAAAVLGLSPFDTPYQLWRRKTGQEQPKPETFVMKAGHILEDAVAQFFAMETGATIDPDSAREFVVMDDAKPFLRVSPDRYYTDPKTGETCILECKTTQKTIDEDDIPKHWYCQLQYQLGVCGMKRGAVAWLTQGRAFGYKEFDFNAEIFAYMAHEVEQFWTKNVKGGEAPAVTTPEDISVKYANSTPDKAKEGTFAVLQVVQKAKMLKAEIKQRQTELDALTEQLKLEMEDAEVLTIGGNTVATWKQGKVRECFDTKLFKKEHPDTYAAYCHLADGSRTFLIK